MDWCIGLSKSVASNTVKRVKINKKDYSVFRTNNGVHGVSDTCPHRGASMSQGRITNAGTIQCPYHGWEFDTSGALHKVPSLVEDAEMPSCKLKSFEITESAGFMFKQNSGKLPTEWCPELFDASWDGVYGSKLVDGNWLEWVSNGSDISHINYVHEFGNENDGRVTNVDLESNEEYIDCYATVRPKAASVLTEHMQPDKELGSKIHSRFIFPNTNVIRIKLKDPYEFITFTMLCPVDVNKTRTSWALLFPKGILSLPPFKCRFDRQMYKTVSEDEAIIRELVSVAPGINAPCDDYQMKVFDMIASKTTNMP